MTFPKSSVEDRAVPVDYTPPPLQRALEPIATNLYRIATALEHIDQMVTMIVTRQP